MSSWSIFSLDAEDATIFELHAEMSGEQGTQDRPRYVGVARPLEDNELRLFVYEVIHSDDIYTHSPTMSFSRTSFVLDIFPRFNSGRGDLAAFPVGDHFIRGDANADGAVDISDGVFTLGWLFLGTDEPSCLDAADMNDSGGFQPDISDAVYLLNWLFLGTAAPPSPGPVECGADITVDELDCVLFGLCS